MFNETNQLKRMNLFHNQIDDQGIFALVNRISILESLFLGENQITNQGAQSLAELIRTNQTLVRLGLARKSNHRSRYDCFSQQSCTIEYNTERIVSLGPKGNQSIDESCVNAFADMLVYNRTLNKLVLFDCNLSNMSKPG